MLEHVEAGDPISAAQWNEMVDILVAMMGGNMPRFTRKGLSLYRKQPVDVPDVYYVSSDFTVSPTITNAYYADAYPTLELASTIEASLLEDSVRVYYLVKPGDDAPTTLKDKFVCAVKKYGIRIIVGGGGGSSPGTTYLGKLSANLASYESSGSVNQMIAVDGGEVPGSRACTANNIFGYTGSIGDDVELKWKAASDLSASEYYYIRNIRCNGS